MLTAIVNPLRRSPPDPLGASLGTSAACPLPRSPSGPVWPAESPVGRLAGCLVPG